ncbi:MAG: LacI family DNA-binding transcriptional regulator [Chitinophagaceae bacterium]|nr:LacI family DNA-binding transcriptional regulator [Chitinophagaceae bacterium]
MKSVNIKELARELKLSISTISKALHDSHEISAKTKKIVLDAAAKFNYIPHPYASSLRGKKSKTIGVVIPEVADSFFSLAINGIESVAKEKGYHVLIYLSHESFENEKNILQQFRGGRVDGVLISVSRETIKSDHINDLIADGIPLIFFDRVCDDVDTAKITTDDFESGYRAAEHLLKKQCRRIAFLSISYSLSISNKRLEGYLQAHQDYKIPADKKMIVYCPDDAKKNYTVIKKLLQQKNRPDAIIASVEKLTAPVYKACELLKLNIPKDIKVICFSNLVTASILNPSLTTITQPAFDMGKTAAKLLFRKLEKKNVSLKKENIVIPSTLIARSSTTG